MAARRIAIDGERYISRHFPKEITTSRVSEAMHFVDSDARIAESRAQEFIRWNRERLPAAAELTIEYV